VILDAQTLLAYFDRTHERHWSAAGEIELLAETERLVVSPFVVVELESLVREPYGVEGWLLVLDELGSGAWTIPPADPAHLRLLRPHVEGGASLVAASLAVLAERYDS